MIFYHFDDYAMISRTHLLAIEVVGPAIAKRLTAMDRGDARHGAIHIYHEFEGLGINISVLTDIQRQRDRSVSYRLTEVIVIDIDIVGLPRDACSKMSVLQWQEDIPVDCSSVCERNLQSVKGILDSGLGVSL